MSIAYIHNISPHFQRGTIAITPLSKKILERVTLQSPGIMLPLGVAYLNPQDYYVKSIGRSIAKDRMTVAMAFLTKVQLEGNRTTYHFSFDTKFPPTYKNPNGELITINFGLSTVPESNNAHVEYAFFSPNN